MEATAKKNPFHDLANKICIIRGYLEILNDLHADRGDDVSSQAQQLIKKSMLTTAEMENLLLLIKNQ